MSIQWVEAWTEALPAVPGGLDRDGSDLYVARAMHEESLIPGTSFSFHFCLFFQYPIT